MFKSQLQGFFRSKETDFKNKLKCEFHQSKYSVTLFTSVKLLKLAQALFSKAQHLGLIGKRGWSLAGAKVGSDCIPTYTLAFGLSLFNDDNQMIYEHIPKFISK